MKYFPFFLRMTADRTAVIVGGGEQAAQKLRLLLKTEARLVVMAPDLAPELAAHVRSGRVEHVAAECEPAALEGARLVVAATEDEALDRRVAELGRAAGAVVNVVDRPELCDVITPAIVDRDPLVVAIGTEGAAPVMARRVKTALEEMLEPSLGGLVARAGALRHAVEERVAPERRRAFWAWFFSGGLRALWRRGEREAVEAAVEATLAAGGAPGPTGAISLVGAGPGSADLITLRGVQRLQEADVIFYDRLVDPAVLELARRDAERVFVGKAPGVKTWSQDRINRLLVAAARAGRRVVRLKCGDPGVFGRAAEEIEALAQAGFRVEIVPGVTAASAAAAEIGRPLTDRAGARALVLASAHPATGAAPVDWATLTGAEAAIAIYMGVKRAAETATKLMEGGASPSTRVWIVARAGAVDARRFETTLARLGETVRTEEVRNPAMILVAPPEPVALALAETG